MEQSPGFQRVGFLTAIPALLRDFGCDPGAVLSQAGLAESDLANPEATISYAAMGNLLDCAVSTTKCPHFGLLVGARVTLSALGLVGELMRNAPSLRVALRDLVRYQHCHASGAAVYLVENGDEAAFGYAIYQVGVDAIEQIQDGASAAAFGLVRELLHAEHSFGMRALLSRPRPAQVSAYSAFFGAVPEFEKGQSAVAIPSAWLDRVLPDALASTRKVLEGKTLAYRSACGDGIVDQVRRTIAVQLQSGQSGGDLVAAELFLSRRSMDRELALQGSGYQKLLDNSRFELSCRLLSGTSMVLGDIGVIVGLNKLSVFSRAFTHWSGMSPSAWRRSKQQEIMFAHDRLAVG